MIKNRRSYYIACCLIMLILIIAITGTWLKPHSIASSDQIVLLSHMQDGTVHYEPAPFTPNGTYWLGSDHRGVDILSLLLNGFKYTLGITLLITCSRFVFALPLGMWSGVTGKCAGFVRSMQWVFSSVPAIIFLFPPLNGMYFKLGLDTGSTADPNYLRMFVLLFYVLVTVIGIFPIADQIVERSRYFHDKQFVTASKLLGAGVRHIIVRHIFPNLRVELLLLFLSEFVQVMFLLGQLAMFNISVFGTETVLDQIEFDKTAEYYYHTSTTGEWFSMIAYGSHYIRQYPWMIISVGCFYTATILSLQFFLNQIKKVDARSNFKA